MKYAEFLWVLVWAGLYSKIYSFNLDEIFTSEYEFIHVIRGFFPILAMTLALLSVFVLKFRKIPIFKTPLVFFFFYCFVGLLGSFISPEILTALYWGSLYLSPILVMWYVLNRNEPLDYLYRIIRINYVLLTILMLSFLPVAIEKGVTAWHALPFNMGDVNRNGIARYALIVIIFSFTRLITQKNIRRYLYFFLLLPALFIIAQAQSRSALFGFGVATVIIMYLSGLNWRFLFAGPLFTYLIWLAAFKWRAKGEIEELVSLAGRDYTWQMSLENIKDSPVFGWGFQADRLMLEFQHMHNSFLQALIQSGIVGTLFFAGAIILIWATVFRYYSSRRVRHIEGRDKSLIIESIALLGFFTLRSFFESTAAFYGIDLLVLLPHICYIKLLSKET